MRSEEFLVEASSMRQRQLLVRNALPQIMSKVGLEFIPVKQLEPMDVYPRLGFVRVEGIYARYDVSADPSEDGKTAELIFGIDVSTSNELYSSNSPVTGAAVLATAEKIAKALNGNLVYNQYSRSRTPVPQVKVTIQLPIPTVSQPQTTVSSYNPRDRFMNQPGERARQARVAGSAYSDSFGGDASNYTR